MNIKMVKSLAGPNVSYRMGQEYDVDDALGEALCSDGRAVPAEADETPKPPKPKRQRQRTSKAPAGDVETRG